MTHKLLVIASTTSHIVELGSLGDAEAAYAAVRAVDNEDAANKVQAVRLYSSEASVLVRELFRPEMEQFSKAALIDLI